MHDLIQAIINLNALRHNLARIRAMADRAEVMAVVKADAYGHGALRVARTLAQEGVRRFAVARIEEGVKLRDEGIDGSILVLGAPLPHQLPLYARHSLGITVSSSEVLEAVLKLSPSLSEPLETHVKIETGMGRIGISPQRAAGAVERLDGATGIDLASVWTHLATADEPDSAFVEKQLAIFDETVFPFRDAVAYVHVANSAALLNHSDKLDLSEGTVIRPGIALYGLSPSGTTDQALAAGLRPVMTLVSTITHVKEVAEGESVSYSRKWRAASPRRIATIAAGYADGYPRRLTNRAEVGIDGRRFPVAGTVCMDMTMADLGSSNGPAAIRPGTTATLFGGDGPSCFELARLAETITYEIVCQVGARVPRVYCCDVTGKDDRT
ncbi:MAG: alanine racemase [Bacteroidota bacterium]